MQQCPQTDTQSVYQHGVSVWEHTQELIQILQSGEGSNNWILPDWVFKYRHHILEKLLPLNIIEEYTVFHDCGKIYCLTYDDQGKRHFPNHAEVSYQTWLNVGGNELSAKLMRMDMMIHTIKANDLDEFVRHPEAITLLIVGLAEIFSNSKMFGGTDSTSFKIKYKQLEKRGKAMIERLFKNKKRNEKTGLCPCSGQCCNNPETFNPNHKCKESICEGCFVSECRNCGSSCCCDL